jgi:hypothetical protein
MVIDTHYVPLYLLVTLYVTLNTCPSHSSESHPSPKSYNMYSLQISHQQWPNVE